MVNLGLLRRFVLLSFAKMKEYKVEILYALLLIPLKIFIVPLVWYAVWAKQAIAGWSFWGVLVFYLLYVIGLKIGDLLGVWGIYVVSVDREKRRWLTTLFSKPVDPLLLLFGLELYLPAVIEIVVYTCVVFGLILLKAHISPWALLLVLMGFALAVSFFTIPLFFVVVFEKNADPIVDLFGVLLFEVGRAPIPDRGAAGFVLTYVVPLAFIASVPARALLEGLSAQIFLVGCAFFALMLAINVVLWRFMLQRFEAIGE